MRFARHVQYWDRVPLGSQTAQCSSGGPPPPATGLGDNGRGPHAKQTAPFPEFRSKTVTWTRVGSGLLLPLRICAHPRVKARSRGRPRGCRGAAGPKPLFMTHVMFHGPRLDPTCPLNLLRMPGLPACAVCHLMTSVGTAVSNFLTFLLKLIFRFYNLKTGGTREAVFDVYVSQSRKRSQFHSGRATHM